MGCVRQHELVVSASGLLYGAGFKGKHDLCYGTRPGCVILRHFVLEVLYSAQSSPFFVLVHSIDFLLPENKHRRQKSIKRNRMLKIYTKSKGKQARNTIHLPPIK